MSTYDEAVNYEYMSNLPEINMKVENFDVDASLHEGAYLPHPFALSHRWHSFKGCSVFFCS